MVRIADRVDMATAREVCREMVTLVFLYGCSERSDSGFEGDTGVVDTGADSGGDTSAPGQGVITYPQNWNWGDGLPGCEWFVAAGPFDDHSLYIVELSLPMSDFDAGVDVSYSRELGAGEVVVWRDDAVTDSRSVAVCSDIEFSLEGRIVPVVSGHLDLSATATGPDETCGSPQTYSVTWALTGMSTEEGEVDDIGPRTNRAGFFGGCYG